MCGVLIKQFFRTCLCGIIYTAASLGMKLKFQWTTDLSKIFYVSIELLLDADLNQVEKEIKSTFIPDADLHQLEMIGIWRVEDGCCMIQNYRLNHGR